MKAKIKAISKTGGILIEGSDQWLNPKNAAVKKLIKPELKGKEVELTLDGNKILNIKELNKEKPTQEYWDTREIHVIRQNVLKHATELVVNFVSVEENEDVSKAVKKVKQIAEELEQWVLRE